MNTQSDMSMIPNQTSSDRMLGKSFLADLDGLLVDSKSFSQLFIQQCDPKWVETKLDKVAQSDIHLTKLIEILTHLITSESHPEWVRKALVWLNFFMRKYPDHVRRPRIRNALKRLCSYVHEISGLEDPYFRAASRSTAIEKWGKSYKPANHVPLSLYYSDTVPIPSTRYVYHDGLNSKPRPAKRKRTKAPANQSLNWLENDDSADDLDIKSSFGSESDTMLKIDEFNPNDQESDESMDSSVESDDGVFDVDNQVSSGNDQSDAEDQSHADEPLVDSVGDDDQDSNSPDHEQDESNLMKEDYIVDDLNSTTESSNESTDGEEDDDDEMPLKLHLEDLGGKSDEDDDLGQDTETEVASEDDLEAEQEKSPRKRTKRKKNSPTKSPKKKAKSKSPSKPKSPAQPKSSPSTATRRSLRSQALPNSDDVPSPSQSRTLRNRNRQAK